MRLRTFIASDMSSAMAQVREALGDEAIIISSTTDKSGKKVTVTAALEEREEEDYIPVPSASALRSIATNIDSDWLEELSLLLRYHNTPESLAGRLRYKARHLELDKLFALQKFGNENRQQVETKALMRLLSAVFRFSPLLINEPGQRIMLVGPAGVGKTLAIAKLAAQMTMDRHPVAVITIDNKRAGGTEQLAAFTDILELPLITAHSPQELAKILKATPRGAHVLMDSFGCNPYDKSEMDELTEFVAVGGFEPILTLPAGMDSFEAADTARAYAFSAISRLLVTRTDTSRRFGSLLAAVDARPLSFCNISNSPRVVEELKTLDAGELAQLMLHYRSQTG